MRSVPSPATEEGPRLAARLGDRCASHKAATARAAVAGSPGSSWSTHPAPCPPTGPKSWLRSARDQGLRVLDSRPRRGAPSRSRTLFERASVDPDLSPDGRKILGPDSVDGFVAYAHASMGHRVRRDTRVTADGKAALEELRQPQLPERVRGTSRGHRHISGIA